MSPDDIQGMALAVGLPAALASHPGVKALVREAVFAEREACEKNYMQLFTDPENQPTQHGTVTFEYMEREIAAEREACAKVIEAMDTGWPECEGDVAMYAAAIRARSDEAGKT
jgi:hypothetical protein